MGVFAFFASYFESKYEKRADFMDRLYLVESRFLKNCYYDKINLLRNYRVFVR